ncbi:uncharacterized protein LOC129798250 [Phlebotomus papatasi]|uniref:MD-2-related lipid-recognition domain-containing protein n=1 Tax=Phlebotomus papatasi TaxID=29031 RepID=A0A1B0DI19_PHLPP|nr:uncharacterized protein LOC129798250 [Phlebotomus papatasi]
MFRFLLLATLLPALALADFPFIPCPGVQPPISFNIPECPGGPPCDFYIGQQITLEIGFEAVGTVTEIPTTAEITLANGEVIDFELPTGDGCNAVLGGCPIDAGVHTVVFPLTIQGVPANEQVTITVTMSDQNGHAMACGSVIGEFGG